jgi:diaminobutyrate-2-oxoglutarate transaminase
VDGWFIDFLGAGAMSLGHCHPVIVQAVRRQMEVFSDGLDFPTEVKDDFLQAQLSMAPKDMRTNMLQVLGSWSSYEPWPDFTG